MLLAGGDDVAEEVVLGGVAGDGAHGVLLDGLDEPAEGVVVEGPLDVGGRDPGSGEPGELLLVNKHPAFSGPGVDSR